MVYPKWHRNAGEPLSAADAEIARVMAMDDDELAEYHRANLDETNEAFALDEYVLQAGLGRMAGSFDPDAVIIPTGIRRNKE